MTWLIHRKLHLLFTLYVAALLSIPAPAHAEDTDIFFINPAVSSLRPNVLIFLDNTSNWGSTDSLDPLKKSRYENVRKALEDTVLSLDERFNVGIMLFSEPGASANPAPDGGVVRAAVRQLTPDLPDGTLGYKKKFANMVGNLQGVGSVSDQGNNAKVGLGFYEAYLYFSGLTAYSGGNKKKRDWSVNQLGETGNQADDNPSLVHSNRVWNTAGNAFTSQASRQYVSPISDACQKNFIIFISNGTTQENTADINEATKFLAAAGGDTTMVTLNPSGLQNNVADEWARFLAITDPVNFPNKPTVISYAVEVNPVNTGNGPAWTEVMKSIGNLGKGKYFGVQSGNGGVAITDALKQIFAEVLAVNSVFASATLPVSVNVRGTFLNQVYMGVFRPDAKSSPRWTGNVKQYRLAPAGSGGALVLVDTAGVPIENAATGFVSPSARSFWTQSESPGFWDLNYYPDVKAQAPLTATANDLPDGEFVEKGGAAQHLRMVHATDVTTRKLFTCISGSCPADIDLAASGADYRFNAANAKITDAMLNLTLPIAVTSLTRTGTTATATTASAHGFTTGQVVRIDGALDPEYRGTYSVAVTGPTTFTYGPIAVTPDPTGTPVGGITASKGGTPASISSMSRSTTNDATSNSSTVSVTTTLPHGFSNGATVTISGALPDAYNGARQITIGPGLNDFSFVMTTSPATPATLSSATATSIVIEKVKGVDTSVSTVRNVNSITRVGRTVTVTTDVNHGFTAGNSVNISGAVPFPSPYDGNFPIEAVTGNRTFTYLLPLSAIGPGTVTAFGQAALPSATLTGLTVTRSDATAKASSPTNPVTAGFTAGVDVTISGADQPEYNGTFKIVSATAPSGPPSNTPGFFTYTVTVNPPTSTTGATATGGGVDRDTLIKWVRGENRKLEDNPVNSASVVRGYLHGDVLHSRPAVVNYNRSTQPADRDIAVFYGSNDGIIHGVQGGATSADGNEHWGFIPEEFFGGFSRLYNAAPKIVPGVTPRGYFGDGPISVNAVYVKDVNGVERIEGGAGEKVQLFIGMRRGGRVYYSLDVTDPAVPIYKWKISHLTPGFDELGQTWSDPKVVTINVQLPSSAAAAERKVLIFGGGYDAAALDSVTPGTATMGRGIYVVDADTGALIWFAGPTPPTSIPSGATYHAVSGMTSAIAADLAVINSDFDIRDRMDRIYAADTGGNIWRANIGDPDPANWIAYKVASLAGTGVNARRFLFAPDIVPFDNSWDSILIGSGDREQPFDTSIANRFYMIKDAHAVNAPAPTTPVSESDLCDLTTSTVLVDADKACLATSSGWMIRLGTGEKTVTGATTLAATTIFATNTPASVVSAPGQCTGNLGRALLYAVNFKDATPELYGMVGGVATARAAERVGGGFPPTPIPVAVKIGDKVYEGAITGTQVVTPGTEAPGQRYRIFWNLSVDS